MFVLLAPAAVPAGLGLAAGLWAWRNYAITTGLGGMTASAPITFDARQWKRQVRTARGLTDAPGAVPLLARGGNIPVGGTIRAIGHRWHPVFTLPATALRPAHGHRRRDRVGEDQPDDPAVGGLVHRHPGRLLGREREPAAAGRAGLQGRPRRPPQSRPHPPPAVRRRAPAASLIWPDEARLSLWDLPARDLAVLLYQMIETGTGDAAYYADILQAALTLAVTAPGGPPVSAAAFLDRLDARLAAPAPGTTASTPPRRTGSAPPPGTCPTSSSATPPCWTGSARPWTAPARWPTPTPGTSSWKAPANPRSPRPRPWR